MKKLAVVLALLLPVVLTAQKKVKPTPYAKTISATDLQKHLYIVAGREMEGRETGMPGQKKAASYIENHFKSIGLKPGNGEKYQINFSVFRDKVVKNAVSVNETAFKPADDFQPLSLTQFNISRHFSEVVFAGHGIADSSYNNYKDLNAIGKLVMIMDGVPSSFNRGNIGVLTKIVNAQKHGAAAMLIVSDNFPRRPLTSPGDMYRQLYRPTQYLNTFYISTKVAAAILGADWASIRDEAKSEELPSKVYRADVHLEFEKEIEKLESSNVLGVLEGSDKKDEYVFLTAHYDHLGMRNDTTIYYGADDDGSGTVSILELADAFVKAKAEGHGPRRSIVFMAVSGEEKGLWGSEYYTANPIYPLDKTTVNLNIDMIGRVGEEYLESKDSANYLYIIGDDKLSTELEPITNQVNSKYVKLKLDRKYNDLNDKNRFYYRSDHYNFAEKGVPIIFYFNGVHADYHRTTDTPDKINYKLLEKRAQLIFYTAWEMANKDTMLKRDLKLETPKAF